MLLSHLTIVNGWHTLATSLSCKSLQITTALLPTAIATLVRSLKHSKSSRSRSPLSTLLETVNVSATAEHVSASVTNVESLDEPTNASLPHEQHHAKQTSSSYELTSKEFQCNVVGRQPVTTDETKPNASTKHKHQDRFTQVERLRLHESTLYQDLRTCL